MAGLAEDGGLYVPKEYPKFSAEKIESLRALSYPDLAFEIIAPFIDGEVEDATLKTLLKKSYENFSHEKIAPLHKLSDAHSILELFHGPTLAFKDFALQFLGRLLEHFLDGSDEKITIIGATSGDTGSAAIAGVMGLKNMDIHIFYPHNKISEVQRRLMTTWAATNVHVIALEGAFGDCQNIVKALFVDEDFRKEKKPVAVNSINFARILAQIVYYFYAYFQAEQKEISFSVPTGNFGDIFAGFIAKQMGLPINKLIIATNKNDILHRALTTGRYEMTGVSPTISPSMDIQISSNFERMLFEIYGRDANLLREKMENFKETKSLIIEDEFLAKLKEIYESSNCSDDDASALIKKIWNEKNYLLDPHTACGLHAALNSNAKHCVTLATAHPAKFPDAVKDASGIEPDLPDHLYDLFSKTEAQEIWDNDFEKVKEKLLAN